MKITVKTTLLAAELPGTFITIDVTAASPTFGFKTVTQADGCDPAVIDWGDGIQTGLDTLAHTYASPGRYTIAISDAIREFGVSAPQTSSSVYFNIYAPMVLSIRANTQRLTSLAISAFSNCKNMTSIDLKDVPITKAPAFMLYQCEALPNFDGIPSALESIQTRSFAKCTGANGSVKMLNLLTFAGGEASTTPFYNTLGITEIHLAKKNEAAITSCPAYQTAPTLGALNATLVWEE